MDFELRPWCGKDAESITRYANNHRIADQLRNIFPHPYRLEDAVAFIAGCVADDDRTRCCRAIVVNSEAVGGIGVFPKGDVYRKSAEIGYWLGEPYWGRGIMSAAIRQICSHALRAYDLVRIFSEPFARNKRSCRALENAGFTHEGTLRYSVWKNGELLDSHLYALICLKNDVPQTPRGRIPLA